MKERRDRILDVAVDLAMEGGFDNVRQRDVAANAGVALGTLYKSFRSKEDILVAAVERQIEALASRLKSKPVKGKNPAARVTAFFEIVTRALIRKPHYARSVIRAMASGEPEIGASLASYQSHMERMIVASLRGTDGPHDCDGADATEAERMVASYLQDIWFSRLVGWSAGFTKQSEVLAYMKTATTRLVDSAELDY